MRELIERLSPETHDEWPESYPEQQPRLKPANPAGRDHLL